MLQELRRLGVVVIYGSYDRLVLSTRKTIEREANENIRFIIDTVQSKDVFRLVNFLNQSTFASLIWYNASNFAGYCVWKEMEEEEVEDYQLVGEW